MTYGGTIGSGMRPRPEMDRDVCNPQCEDVSRGQILLSNVEILALPLLTTPAWRSSSARSRNIAVCIFRSALATRKMLNAKS
jgi:hypothetical protein